MIWIYIAWYSYHFEQGFLTYEIANTDQAHKKNKLTLEKKKRLNHR